MLQQLPMFIKLHKFFVQLEVCILFCIQAAIWSSFSNILVCTISVSMLVTDLRLHEIFVTNFVCFSVILKSGGTIKNNCGLILIVGDKIKLLSRVAVCHSISRHELVLMIMTSSTFNWLTYLDLFL